MSSYIWFFLLVMKYLCLLSLKSLVLGLFMFVCSLCMSLLISMYSLSWYSLMFFLVYMGGLLVLFMYMSSLNFNPVFYLSKMSPSLKLLLKVNLFLLFFFVMTEVHWKFKSAEWESSDMNNFSLNLFSETEFLFLMKVGALLLVVLWVITKLSFRNRGALRPFFG